MEIVRGIFRDKGPLGFFQVWGGSLFDNCDGLLVMMMTKAWTSIETTMTTFLERQDGDYNQGDDDNVKSSLNMMMTRDVGSCPALV